MTIPAALVFPRWAEVVASPTSRAFDVAFVAATGAHLLVALASTAYWICLLYKLSSNGIERAAWLATILGTWALGMGALAGPGFVVYVLEKEVARREST